MYNELSWKAILVCVTLICSVFFAVIVQSYIFSYSYIDHRSYLEDLFNFSQWRIPQSSRIISDEQLYQVAGDYIIRGNSLYDINPEVPPLAKYLYGFSIVVFDNPYITSVTLYFATIFVFVLLTRQLRFTIEQTVISTVLFALSPIYFSQISQTMLDLPLLFFVLLHSYFYIYILLKKNRQHSVVPTALAGLLLGFAAAVKFPVFICIILCFECTYLLCKKQLQTVTIYAVCFCFGYVLPFLYFIHTHSIYEFISAQKWMVDFYRHQYSEVSILGNVQHYFSGYFLDYAGIMQKAEGWSTIIPITGIGVCIRAVQKLRTRTLATILDEPILYYCFVYFILALPLLYIYLYTRYFLLLLPYGIICLVSLYSQKIFTKILFAVIIVLSVFQAILFSNQPPDTTLKFPIESWSHGNYQDFYNYITNTESISREGFFVSLKRSEFASQATAMKISFDIPRTSLFSRSIMGTATVVYSTPAGEYSHTHPVQFIKQNGQWNIVWDWKIIAENMSAEATITVNPPYLRYSKVLTQDRSILSQQIEQPKIYIIPAKIVDRATFIADISNILNTSGVSLENYIYVQGKGVELLPYSFANAQQLTQLQAYIQSGALKVVNAPAQITYNGRLSPSSLEKVKAFQAEHIDELVYKPNLLIVDPKGNSSVLIENSKQIQDIVYPATGVDLF